MQKRRNGIFLGLGSNINSPSDNLTTASILLSKLPGIIIKKESKIYKTKPYGNENQPYFFNKVIEIETNYSPKELLHFCLKIEKKMGRVKKEHWGPRIIDIDILFYHQLIINKKELIIPHYDFENRDFFIIPMLEIAKYFIHPITNQTILEIAAHLFEKNINIQE